MGTEVVQDEPGWLAWLASRLARSDGRLWLVEFHAKPVLVRDGDFARRGCVAVSNLGEASKLRGDVFNQPVRSIRGQCRSTKFLFRADDNLPCVWLQSDYVPRLAERDANASSLTDRKFFITTAYDFE